MTEERSIGFAPEVTPQTRILILGSLPGIASLKAGQYYAHPRNGFWPIMSELTGGDFASAAYAERLRALKSYGVGLWDVLASAQRSGSLDAAIRSPEAADLVTLVSSLPDLQVVAFNGATAAKIGRRILSVKSGALELVELPSSSPAHAALSLAAKTEIWRERLGFPTVT